MLGVAVIDTDFVYPGGGDYRGLLREIPVADQARPLMAHIPELGARLQRAARRPAAGHPPRVRSAAVRSSARSSACCEEQDGQARGAERRAGRGTPGDDEPIDITLGELDPAATEFLATLPYPRYYLDFETVQFAVPPWEGTQPFQQLVFQWSCHAEDEHGDAHPPRVPGHERARARCAPRPRRCWRRSATTGPIFVYHDFEKWRLVEMARHVPRPGAALWRP